MSIVINDDNLKLWEIEDFSRKVRAFLIDNDNNVLIAHYGNVILLPGGSSELNEDENESIVRELNEEIGKNYEIDELDYLETVVYYQKNYKKRGGNKTNRLILTSYYVGKYKGLGKQTLTSREVKGNFRLELVPLDRLEELVLNNENNNPRNKFFVKELLVILECYRNKYVDTLIKKK